MHRSSGKKETRNKFVLIVLIQLEVEPVFGWGQALAPLGLLSSSSLWCRWELIQSLVRDAAFAPLGNLSSSQSWSHQKLSNYLVGVGLFGFVRTIVWGGSEQITRLAWLGGRV